MIDQLRSRYRRWRIRRRRKKLLRAYSRVFKRRTGKQVGFTPIMAAWSYAERDGLLTQHDDGTMEWHWPSEATEVEMDDLDE
ncbi:hypothetical protein DM826_07490 [Halonotius aquaticus]|uniref:Uncharacterized protein n=1 Tax=Halonotius aquaticus TaxID=2216978 RepID=A0A3A6PRG6_9EURY|nr:hypothetical protein DM826_07490 [Halonotius aquaticus]